MHMYKTLTATMASPFPNGPGINSRAAVLGAACIFTAAAALIPLLKATTGLGRGACIESPKGNTLRRLSEEEISKLPYPPDVLPGGRDVVTPYGSIRVFEWGPENGDKVLLLHGISTPTISLGDLAHELVGKGYRVMLFGKWLLLHK